MNNGHVEDMLKTVEEGQGEGLMLRNPTSLYENRRVWSMLKVKSSIDDDAKIEKCVYHKSKSGRKGGKKRLKALIMRTDSGEMFRLRNGLNEELDKRKLEQGMVVTFKHRGIDNEGKPKCPTFFRLKGLM